MMSENLSEILSPKHYKSKNGLEAIDVIETWSLNYHLGNAVKYIIRAGRKDDSTVEEDLNKAIWYLKRELRRRSLKVAD